MQLIQQLETLGQSGSLKQFDSVSNMLNQFNLDSKMVGFVRQHSQELICMVEPDDDEDDK